MLRVKSDHLATTPNKIRRKLQRANQGDLKSTYDGSDVYGVDFRPPTFQLLKVDKIQDNNIVIKRKNF